MVSNHLFTTLNIAINMRGNNITIGKDKRLAQIYASMSLLKCLLKAFCLNDREKTLSQDQEYCLYFRCGLTMAVLGAANIYSLIYKSRYVFPSLNVSISMTDVIQMFFDYTQYIVDLYFVFKYGKNISVEYHKQYASFDQILDIVHYTEIRQRLTKLLIMLLFFWFTSSCVDFAAWTMGYGWIVPTIYSLAYVFLLIKILTSLDLTAQVINIECRLRVIGDLVQDCYDSAESLPQPGIFVKGALNDQICNKNWFYAQGCARAVEMRSRAHPLKNMVQNHYSQMRWLNRCYLLLTEQCSFINRIFGIRILLNSLSLLIDMVRFLNVAVRLSVGTQMTTYSSGYFPVVSCLMRLAVCIALLTSLVYHCEAAYAQQDRICSLINHILVNKNPEDKLRLSVSELRDLITVKPIRFSMSNFFSLNYPFLVSLASVVVSYTIILLQSI